MFRRPSDTNRNKPLNQITVDITVLVRRHAPFTHLCPPLAVKLLKHGEPRAVNIINHSRNSSSDIGEMLGRHARDSFCQGRDSFCQNASRASRGVTYFARGVTRRLHGNPERQRGVATGRAAWHTRSDASPSSILGAPRLRRFRPGCLTRVTPDPPSGITLGVSYL